ICNVGFYFKCNLISHLKDMHKGPFTDEDCGEAFKSVEELEQYKNSILCKKSFKCEICKQYFQYRAKLIQHQIEDHRLTTEEVIYVCGYPGCNEAYMQRSSLIKHQNFKHLPCGEEMITYDDLKVHRQSCEQCENFVGHKKLTNIKTKRSPDNEILKSFKCEICKEIFQREAQLIQHQIQEHQLPPRKIIYECNYPGCNQVYIDQESLHRHQNFKHLPCGTKVVNHAGLKAHKQSCQQCQNFVKPKRLKTTKGKRLSDDKILSAKDKTDNTQPEENKSTRIAKQPIKNNDLNTTSEIRLSSQSIKDNHSPDEYESDNWIFLLTIACPEFIRTITNNLLTTKNFIDNHNYQDAASTFSTAMITILNLKNCFSKFKFIDSSCTENNNTTKIDTMCNTLKEIEDFILKNFPGKKDSITDILQKIETITKTMHEIFADWQLVLQSKNHSAIQHESSCSSGNEEIDLPISSSANENLLLPESQDSNSLFSDFESFLERHIETLSDLPLLQQMDRDILLNPE
ncbi:MAG: hypothetical protein OXC48_03400, partial [Endozoicomonadaceae bacterium]|nr:hypothetical protein [Endozoicomonadaceae bacterium]